MKEAARELADGQCVGLPTETVYGLAADALRPDAVTQIFEAKERPFFDPLIVQVREVFADPQLPRDTLHDFTVDVVEVQTFS